MEFIPYEQWIMDNMANNDLQETARTLAARPYTLFTFLDKTTTGDDIYVATNPDLPGCYAQGDTMQEAVDILVKIREDYIAHLLAHNLTVPDPIVLIRGDSYSYTT